MYVGHRATKADVRLLSETIATANSGTVCANAVMPSVIDTPMNRAMTPDADFDAWETADTLFYSDAATVTSAATVPAHGEA